MPSPSEILVCDSCKQPITDLDMAMVFWEADSNAGMAVTALRLAHKLKCDAPELGRSIELSWLATDTEALDQLAGLVNDYKWNREQMARLVQIAWAVPRLGNPDE